MASKLEAARIASWSGVPTVIANAARPGVLAAAAAGESVGTRFEARRRQPHGAQAVDRLRRPHRPGAIIVDDGARRALVERKKSLLPAGVVSVEGRFVDGDTVEVRGADGTPSPAAWSSSTPPSCARSRGCRPATFPRASSTR